MECKAQNVRCKTKFKSVKVLILTLLLYTLTFNLYASPAYAACDPGTQKVNIGDCFGFGGITSLGEGTKRLVDPIFSIATAIVVIYFLLGAFNYVKSGGNKEEVQKAREMITHSIIGFLILMFAFFIIQFLPQYFHLPGLDIIRR